MNSYLRKMFSMNPRFSSRSESQKSSASERESSCSSPEPWSSPELKKVQVPAQQPPKYKATTPEYETRTPSSPTWSNDSADCHAYSKGLKREKVLSPEQTANFKLQRQKAFSDGLLSRDSSFSSLTSSSSSSSVESLCSPRISPALKSARSSAGLPRKPKGRVSFSNPSKGPAVFVHPLLACDSSHPAPIYYDASVAPATPTVVDFLGKRIPLCTLLEPATEPPTRGKLALSSDEFPWTVVAHASNDSPHADFPTKPSQTSQKQKPRQKPRFFIGEEEEDPIVSNLDVLCAVHATLASPITKEEWDVLGEGGAEQRRVARAYRQRCRDQGGDWGAGVKRIDFLKTKTILVGVESRGTKQEVKAEVSVAGKLIFAEDRS